MKTQIKEQIVINGLSAETTITNQNQKTNNQTSNNLTVNYSPSQSNKLVFNKNLFVEGKYQNFNDLEHHQDHQQKYTINISTPHINQNNQITNDEKSPSEKQQNRSKRLFTFNTPDKQVQKDQKSVIQIQNQLKEIQNKMKLSSFKSQIPQVDQEGAQKVEQYNLNIQIHPSQNMSPSFQSKDSTPPFHNQLLQNTNAKTQVLFIPNFSDVYKVNERQQKQYTSSDQQSDDQSEHEQNEQKRIQEGQKQQNFKKQQIQQMERQKQKMTTPKFQDENEVNFAPNDSPTKPIFEPMSFNVQKKVQIKAEKTKDCKCNLI